MNISAIDISTEALLIYKKTNKRCKKIIHGSILKMPFDENSYDGIYNLGVMEHFTLEDIEKILAEFYRVLKKDGRIILFWPMAYAPYEIFLNIVEGIYNFITKKNYHLYPDEISRLKTRKHGPDILKKNHFKDVKFFFNFRDAFSLGVVIGTKAAD